MHEALSRALFEEEVGKLPSALFKTRGWSLFSKAYPLLDVSFSSNDGARLRLRVLCDDWNDLPPSVDFFNWEGQQMQTIERDPAGVFNNSPHPITRRPFVCMKGVREYHTHSSHTTDRWDAIKNDPRYSLGGILTQIWHAWKDIHK